MQETEKLFVYSKAGRASEFLDRVTRLMRICGVSRIEGVWEVELDATPVPGKETKIVWCSNCMTPIEIDQ